MGYSGAGGKLIQEKNQKQKISWHCPFNQQFGRSLYCWNLIGQVFPHFYHHPRDTHLFLNEKVKAKRKEVIWTPIISKF